MIQPIKSLFKKTPLYTAYANHLEKARLRELAREYWKWSSEDQKRLEFYRAFVGDNDLVFDVGANVGNRAKVFSKLGAEIVAIEPQTVCADYLENIYRKNRKFHLVRKALGARPGQAEMMIANAHTISSLSAEWIAAVRESGRFAEYDWNRTQTVSIDTLDNLISRYGTPRFIKIDVEGFEHEVVSGLSTLVHALSLEFAPEYLINPLSCIEHLDKLGDYRYQLSLGESMEYHLPGWVDTKQIVSALEKVSPETFGDLYARLVTD